MTKAGPEAECGVQAEWRGTSLDDPLRSEAAFAVQLDPVYCSRARNRARPSLSEHLALAEPGIVR